MIEAIRDRVKSLLESGTIKGFFAMRRYAGNTAPHLFCDPKELGDLSIGDNKKPGDTRYPLNKQLINLARAYPNDIFGILVRGCDERGLKTLYTWNQLNPEKVISVGIPCPQTLADACECLKPFPEDSISGELAKPAEAKSVSSIDKLPIADRFKYWMAEFGKCIKCFGCRDICPMCFCKECSIDTDELVKTGSLPPDIPIFHLARAVHMAGRCIDCGLCNEACPADIPLRTLYKKVSEILDTEFQFRPGYESNQKSPLNLPNVGK